MIAYLIDQWLFEFKELKFVWEEIILQALIFVWWDVYTSQPWIP